MAEKLMRGPLPEYFPPDPERIRKAAELIVAMRQNKITLDVGLPAEAKPRNLDEAQQVNELVISLLGRPIRGWKYYCSARIQEPPLLTPIFDIYESPARLPAEVSQHRWIEPEIAFRCVGDFPAREKKYGPDEVANGVEAVPVFEIIGPRYRFESHNHLRTLRKGPRTFDAAADANASGGYVVGTARRDWQEVDFQKMRVTMKAGDDLLVDTVGGHPLVDPFLAIVPLVNTMRGREGLRAGQLLATHSYSGFIPVPADQPVISTFDNFATIEATFEGSPA